jgi:hypothetical protein
MPKLISSSHTSPRQYTQKFKCWHLQKYVRRKVDRKPRRSASVYHKDQARTRASHELGNPWQAKTEIQLDLDILLNPFFLGPLSGVHGIGEDHNRMNWTAEASQPGDSFASSATVTANDTAMPGSLIALMARNERPARLPAYTTPQTIGNYWTGFLEEASDPQ